MNKITPLNRRITAFVKLGKIFRSVAEKNPKLLPSDLLPFYDGLNTLVANEHLNNQWFIDKFIRFQLKAIAEVLTEKKITEWLTPYLPKLEQIKPINIGVVFAGNIPLVGFADILAVLISGHNLIAKLSSKDQNLPKAVLNILSSLESDFKNKIIIKEQKLNDYQAVIATGSNNTARYFKYYFRNVPHIIRTNKTSIAILNGFETDEQIKKLADDIMLYFGLGCRNVSKIFIPQNFDLNKIFKAIYHYAYVADNSKYFNNYIYNRTIYLMNDYKFLDNGFFLMKEDTSFFSPVGVLFYEKYDNLEHLVKYLNNNSDKIQTIVSKIPSLPLKTVPYGKAQMPELNDYADGIDTMKFLLSL